MKPWHTYGIVSNIFLVLSGLSAEDGKVFLTASLCFIAFMWFMAAVLAANSDS